MTVLLLFRCVGKCLSLATQNYGVAGSNPAAATNPGAFLAERARDTGRKRLCTPADPSVRIAFPVAREFFLSSPRTRRDALPPGSGGLLLSGSFPCGPPLMCWTLRR